MTRRRWTWLALAVAVAVVVTLAARRPGEPRCRGCNVLLVTFDSLRADRLGVYGSERATSPNIDTLARRSAVFLRNLSQSASTIASIPSIHTSKFPHVDLLLDGGVLRPAERTLAEILSDAGYDTAAVIAHEYARCQWGACQGFAATDDVYTAPEAAARTAERALAALAARRPPFFLWVHVRHPHAPYDPAPDVFARMYGSDGPQPTFYSSGPFNWVAIGFRLPMLNAQYASRGEPIQRMSGGVNEVTPTVLRQLVAMYDGSIREGDGVLGRLLEQLSAAGEASRTVVVIAADHGESLGEHQLLGHNLLWYGTLHTPLIVHVPGAAPGVFARPTMNVDIMPTILDVLELPVPERIRGLSVFGKRTHAVRFAESSRTETVLRDDLRLSAGRGSRRSKLPLQLFDVGGDPNEQVDLAPARPDAVRELVTVLDGIRRVSLAVDPKAPDTDVEKKLRALGYIK